MLVKDKKSGEVVGMRYGAAMEAVAAGTHEVVNETAGPAEPPVGPEALAGTDGGITPEPEEKPAAKRGAKA